MLYIGVHHDVALRVSQQQDGASSPQRRTVFAAWSGLGPPRVATSLTLCVSPREVYFELVRTRDIRVLEPSVMTRCDCDKATANEASCSMSGWAERTTALKAARIGRMRMPRLVSRATQLDLRIGIVLVASARIDTRRKLETRERQN